MNFISNWFRKNKAESVVLIDITAGSVAGAYVRRAKGQAPTIFYSRRLPIEGHRGESSEKAMFRALALLGDVLIKEGAPALSRATGSGSLSDIIVSVDMPWQETSVRTEYFESEQAFTFTKALAEKAIQKTGCASGDKVVCDESIVGVLLNGYETRDPYGKSAHRAAVVIMSSFIDQSVAGNITAMLRGIYHTRRIQIIAGSSLRYQALRATFPHEHNALILDATGSLVSIQLVRNSLLVAISEMSDGMIGDSKWIKEMTQGLTELAKQYPLPRTIFILVRENENEIARKALAKAEMGSLWLSDNPPKIVTILPSHFTSLVVQADTAINDLPILLMALYAHYRNG